VSPLRLTNADTFLTVRHASSRTRRIRKGDFLAFGFVSPIGESLGNTSLRPYHYHPEMEVDLDCAQQRSPVCRGSYRAVQCRGSRPAGFQSASRLAESSRLCACGTVVVQFLPEFLGHGFFDLPEMSIVRRLFDRAARGVCFSPAARKKVSHSFPRSRQKPVRAGSRTSSKLSPH
jgi:hypothetical protein